MLLLPLMSDTCFARSVGLITTQHVVPCMTSLPTSIPTLCHCGGRKTDESRERENFGRKCRAMNKQLKLEALGKL